MDEALRTVPGLNASSDNGVNIVNGRVPGGCSASRALANPIVILPIAISNAQPRSAWIAPRHVRPHARMTWDSNLFGEKDRLRRLRALAKRTLGGLGLSERMIREYMGPRREELEWLAAMDEVIAVNLYLNKRSCFRARDLLDLVVRLEQAEAGLADLREKRRQARSA